MAPSLVYHGLIRALLSLAFAGIFYCSNIFIFPQNISQSLFVEILKFSQEYSKKYIFFRVNIFLEVLFSVDVSYFDTSFKEFESLKNMFTILKLLFYIFFQIHVWSRSFANVCEEFSFDKLSFLKESIFILSYHSC